MLPYFIRPTSLLVFERKNIILIQLTKFTLCYTIAILIICLVILIEPICVQYVHTCCLKIKSIPHIIFLYTTVFRKFNKP